MRQYMVIIMFSNYFLFIQFLSASWFLGILTRIPAIILQFGYQLWMRELHNDEIVIGQAIVLAFLVLIVTESSLYQNIKSELQLFQKIKIVKIQQEQLIGILNAVPSSVYICSKTSEEEEIPTSLFSNQKMNRFFACNVLNYSKQRITKLGERKRKLSEDVRSPNPLYRRIFSSNDLEGIVKRKQRALLCKTEDQTNKRSLIDIIQQHNHQIQNSTDEGVIKDQIDENEVLKMTQNMNQTSYQEKFRVVSPNPYENEEGPKTVEVSI